MPKITVEFKRKTFSAIILHYECSDGKLKYYTGLSGDPSNINRATQLEINRRKETIEKAASDYSISGRELSKAALKEILDLKYRPARAAKTTLAALSLDVIEKMKSGVLTTPSKKKYSPGTIKGIRHTVRLLQEFDPDLRPVDVTLQTYKKFISWCHGKNYSTNYIGGQIKNWKTLGKAVGGNPVYDSGEFKIITEQTYDIYLTEEELKAMYDLKLNERESLVRDWFLLDCYTGLRVSDLTLLTDQNYSKGYITIANEKTDESVKIPEHPIVKAIRKKYKGFPRKITDVEINRTIKKVAQKAKIKGDVLFTITKGGKREDEYLKKWEMVSNHTARRSFITNLRKSGVPDSIIMKLTGIKSFSTLARYDKLSTDEAATIAKGHKFFK